jgi:hypothetical protein
VRSGNVTVGGTAFRADRKPHAIRKLLIVHAFGKGVRASGAA